MRFAVESWAPEYGASLDSEQLPEAAAEVDCSVEVDASQWSPVTPSLPAAPRRLLFVDGVRRVDARVWITGDDGVARPAIAASWAAGVACAAPAGGAQGAKPPASIRGTHGDRAAQVEHVEVRRGLFSAAPELAAIVTRHGDYRACAVAGDTVDALTLGLQQRMGQLEATVAASAGAADLLVVDGPLSKLPDLGNAVGYVKTHQRSYLPSELTAVVGALRVAQRTPLFITTGASWSRYSWYARLPSTSNGHPWAGVVRGEASGDLAPGDARRLADLATATLPTYASAAHKDPRAPQNLYPIAGLERTLRRRLGDPALMYRCLRQAAA